MFADDPDWEEFQMAIAENRRELDAMEKKPNFHHPSSYLKKSERTDIKSIYYYIYS
jgi:hypothetical protein